MEFKDYYAIMGLSPSATSDDIKRTYRKLARKYHPDVSQETNAEEKFKEVGEAYEVLKDPEKRRAYDQLRTQGFRQGEQFSPPPNWRQDEFSFDASGGDFSDFFESLFGGRSAGGFARGRHQRGSARGEDIYYILEIDARETINSGSRTIQIPVTEFEAGRVKQRMKTIVVKIPKGVEQGQQIRLKGQGSPGFQNGPAGDLYLEIHIKALDPFHIEGRDVTVYLPVTPWEAALGAKVKAPTLEGTIQVTIPANSQTGTKLRLKGKGLPSKKGAGDQYILLQIYTPPATTEEAKSLYRELAEKTPYNPREKLGV